MSSQLVYGPLSDHFGRRRVLFFGRVLCALASLGAAFDGSFNRAAFGYAISTALVFGCLFAFLNSAQQIYQEVYDGTVLPLALGFLSLSAASFIILRFTERGRLFGASPVADESSPAE